MKLFKRWRNHGLPDAREVSRRIEQWKQITGRYLTDAVNRELVNGARPDLDRRQVFMELSRQHLYSRMSRDAQEPRQH